MRTVANSDRIAVNFVKTAATSARIVATCFKTDGTGRTKSFGSFEPFGSFESFGSFGSFGSFQVLRTIRTTRDIYPAN
jgi:hypothetical protein